jgi:hypothetical protein
MRLRFWRRRESERAASPIDAFDQVLEELERQAGEARKAAATLLALGSELKRTLERYRAQREVLIERRLSAQAMHDHGALSVIERDLTGTAERMAATEASLARAEGDGQVLLAAAKEIAEELWNVKGERESAAARFAVDSLVVQALKARLRRFTEAIALDAARDELERAHALAAVWREDRARS